MLLNMLVRVITSRQGVGQEVLMPVPSIDSGLPVDDLIDFFCGRAYSAECAVEYEPRFYVIIITTIKCYMTRLMRLAAP